MTSTARHGALTIQDLESLRGTLVRVREENVVDLETARSTLATMVGDGTAGSPSLREEVANAEYMIEDASSIIEMIDEAVRRMDAGTYGTCIQCHQGIPLPRLQLRPYGPKCVACAS